MRIVFEETGGILHTYVVITELPVAAEAISIRGLIKVLREGQYTWAIALTGEGSAWAHLHLVGRRPRIRDACKLTAEARAKRKRP